MDITPLTAKDEEEGKKVEPNKSGTHETSDDITLYLDTTSKWLESFATQSERSYYELRSRLSGPVPYIASVTLGMLLILFAALAIVVSALNSKITFSVDIEKATLVAGVFIFLTGVLLEGVTRIFILRDMSRKSAEYSHVADKLGDLELRLKRGV